MPILPNMNKKRILLIGLVLAAIITSIVVYTVMSTTKTLKTGDAAPDFTLTDQDGQAISLSQFKGNKNVVLYFYPKDETPGCTKEACKFRDEYEAFTDLGTEVLGVSSDGGDSHKKFAANYRLPFRLLSDKGGAVRKIYGVPNTFFLLPGRVTFVIDKEGTIRHIFNSQFNSEQHIDEALNVLKTL